MTENQPEKKFQAGAVSASVWKNKGKNKKDEDVEWYTVSINRVYTDKEGNPKNTDSYGREDLHKVITVAQKAYEYVGLK